MDTETIERKRALAAEGYVVVPRALSAEQVRWAREATDVLRPRHWDYSGIVDQYKCVFNRHPGWLAYLEVPGIIELMEAVLGPDCHIIGQTAWRCHPGYDGSGLHLDHLPFDMPEAWLATPGFDWPAQICTVHFFLQDMDADLCPTCVIPGSHRAGRAPREAETDWKGVAAHPVLCRSGDALVFRSDLWHSGSRNRTPDRIRYLLQVHYGRRMVAQKFAPYLEWRFDPEVLASATPRQRRLLGEHEEAEYD